MGFKIFDPLRFLPLLFPALPLFAQEPILPEKALRQALHPAEIQEIIYRDVRGNGKKDAVVFYTKAGQANHSHIVCGVGVFGQNRELLWKQEEPCYGGEGDLVYLDRGKPLLPFIRLTPCQNASIGCQMYLFRWDGSGFKRVFVGTGGDEVKIEMMGDGRPVLSMAWRGRGVPNLWAYEEGKMVDCSASYPDFYLAYVQKAYEALDPKISPDYQRLRIGKTYLSAFIYAKKYTEGLQFCEKLRPYMEKADRWRREKLKITDQKNPKEYAYFQNELEQTIAQYKKWQASFENPLKEQAPRIFK